MYDTAWVHPTLASPGKHTYFVVCKLADNRVFKTQIETIVHLRGLLINPDKLAIAEKKEHKKVGLFYSDTFQHWHVEDHALFTQCYDQDSKSWPQDGKRIFGVKNDEEMEQIKYESGQYLGTLFFIYKSLASKSESYPLLGYQVVRDWVKQMNIYDKKFNF